MASAVRRRLDFLVKCRIGLLQLGGMRVGKTMSRGSISNMAAVSATEISARTTLANALDAVRPVPHSVRIASRRVPPQDRGEDRKDQNTPRKHHIAAAAPHIGPEDERRW